MILTLDARRARRLYEAALHLLKAGLPEEAGIIGRSLFETAMRLKQLAADPADRDVLIIGWVGDSAPFLMLERSLPLAE